MTGRDLAAKCWIGLPGQTLDPDTERVLRRFPPDGVVLFARNVSPRAEQIKKLIADLQALADQETGRPMTLTIDQEGGTVKRLPPPFGQYPDAASYGPRGEEAARDWGLRQGRELKELGFTMDLAPVADVNTLGEAGIMARRAFGQEPEVVARLAAAAAAGLREAGLAACAKHFPGIGHSTLDSHIHRPVIERSLAELEECELVPFRALIEADIEAVMVGHLVYPALDPDRPASLSPVVNTDLLRDKLGFGGLILSDDLEMGAIVGGLTPQQAAHQALEAGADRVLICQHFEQYVRLVEG